jgi:hypothetical protein
VHPLPEEALGRGMNLFGTMVPARGWARVRSRPLGRRSLDLNHAHQFLWFYSEGVYQPCLGVLGVPLITVPDTYGLTSLARYDLSQMHTVQHKPRKSSVRGHNLFGAKGLECAKI